MARPQAQIRGLGSVSITVGEIWRCENVRFHCDWYALPSIDSSLAPSARATRHGHARACRPSHAAARELFGDMRRSPGGEELDDHEAVWIWWQQTRHPSRAHGLRHGRWGPRRMGCSAAHLARQAASKDVPARPQAGSCGSKLPHGNGSHSVSTRGLQGGAKGQGWARNPRALCQGVPQAQR